MVCNGRRVVTFNEGLGLLGSIHWSENGWPFRVWSGNGYRFSGQVWKMGILPIFGAKHKIDSREYSYFGLKTVHTTPQKVLRSIPLPGLLVSLAGSH